MRVNIRIMPGVADAPRANLKQGAIGMAAIRLTACTASIFGAIDIQMKLRLGMAGQTRRHTMASPMPAQADKESAGAAAKRRNGLALTTILLSLVPFVLWGCCT